VEQFSISADLESAAARRDESERLDALAEFENFGRQTDGLRRVVSNDAVFDRHLSFHARLLSGQKVMGCAKCGQARWRDDVGLVGDAQELLRQRRRRNQQARSRA